MFVSIWNKIKVSATWPPIGQLKALSSALLS